MSIRIMTAVWERTDISSTQKLVLLALADWANDEGLCWPSIEKLCNKSSLSRRTVQAAIRGLCDMGLLIQQASTGRSCKYWLKMGAHEIHPCSSRAPEAQELRSRGAAGSPNTSEIHQNTPKDMSSGDDLSVQDVVDAWNDLAAECGLAEVVKVTPARRRQVQARIKEYPSSEDWGKALSAIERSKFMCGDNDRGWRANFDFLLQPSTFIKLLEGTYDR